MTTNQLTAIYALESDTADEQTEVKLQERLTCKLNNIDLSHNTGVGQAETQHRAFLKMNGCIWDVFVLHKYLITIHLWFTCAPWSSYCNLHCLCLPVCYHAVFHLCIDNSPVMGIFILVLFWQDFPDTLSRGSNRLKQIEKIIAGCQKQQPTATVSHSSLTYSEGMQWDWSVRECWQEERKPPGV